MGIDSAIIDFTETSYDLELADADWLPAVIERGLPVLDRGLGVACMEYGVPPDEGEVALRGVHVGSGPEDFPEKHLRALETTPPDVLRRQLRPGADTISGVGCDEKEIAHYTSHVDYCEDLLYITALDERGAGVAVLAPLPEVTKLTPHESQRWNMLAAHLEAGHRLRQGLSAHSAEPLPSTGLPHDAEAIFDARSFRISDAVGQAKESAATKKLRDAAIAIDRARGPMRGDAPDEALEMWRALIAGRWSAVDWFDTDGRRFVLAIPNPPHVTDPRALTERERQVASYVALGHANKMIEYRLGLSRSRVSVLVRRAMHKLGARTRAELIARLRDFQPRDEVSVG